jgi:hypothetical protein
MLTIDDFTGFFGFQEWSRLGSYVEPAADSVLTASASETRPDLRRLFFRKGNWKSTIISFHK